MTGYIGEEPGALVIGVRLSRKDVGDVNAHEPVTINLREEFGLEVNATLVLLADDSDEALKAAIKALLPNGTVRRLETYAELRQALEESVRLQSHYAKLLNTWDGGERIGFENAEKWLERLREMKGKVQ